MELPLPSFPTCVVSVLIRAGTFYFFGAGFGAFFAQTPHVPPPFAQCLHDEHVLHALQSFAPVHVAANVPALKSSAPTNKCFHKSPVNCECLLCFYDN